MSPAHQHAVRIAAPPAAKTLSRVRKQFNTLVKKLQDERVKLRLWHDELPKIQGLAASELMPLIDAYDGHNRTLFFLYDEAWANKALSKRDREKLSDLISKTGLDLMHRGHDDAAVKAIYDKHTALAFDMDDLEKERDVLLQMVSATTGIELDADVDLSSPHAIYEAMQAKLDEQAHNMDARPNSRAARHHAEELKLKQSVRDIFRKLASALHPDREADPSEHARKTDLMQRVNAAYAANDLLGLLELQLEVEQIDQASLDKMDEKRVKQYNQVLTAQIKEIEDDIMALEATLALDMGLDLDRRRGPKALLRDLREEIGKMREDVRSIEADLVNFRDVKKLKAWLKDYRITADLSGFDAPWF